MANLNLGQDVANNREENKHYCSYSGQILSPRSKLQERIITVLLY